MPSPTAFLPRTQQHLKSLERHIESLLDASPTLQSRNALLQTYNVLRRITQQEFEKMPPTERAIFIEMVEKLAAQSVLLSRNSSHNVKLTPSTYTEEALTNVLTRRRQQKRAQINSEKTQQILAQVPPHYVSLHRILFHFKEAKLLQRHLDELNAFIARNILLSDRNFIRLSSSTSSGAKTEDKLRRAALVYQDLQHNGAREWAITMCIIVAVGNMYRRRHLEHLESAAKRKRYRQIVHDYKVWNMGMRKTYEQMTEEDKLRHHIEAAVEGLSSEKREEILWILEQVLKMTGWSIGNRVQYLEEKLGVVCGVESQKLNLTNPPQKLLPTEQQREYKYLKHVHEIGKDLQIPEIYLLQECSEEALVSKNMDEVRTALQYDIIDAFTAYWKEIRYAPQDGVGQQNGLGIKSKM